MRGKLETLYDILTVLAKQGPSRITWLMHKANVNCTDAMRFLGYLMRKVYVDKQGSFYLITPQGRAFYHKLEPWGHLEKHLRDQHHEA